MFSNFANRLINHVGVENIIRYYPLVESTGTVAFDRGPNGTNGTYSGPTLAQIGTPDGSIAPDFSGTTEFVDCDTNAATDFGNWNVGSIMYFMFVPPAPWTDGQTRNAIEIEGDGSNTVRFTKNNNNNQIRYRIEISGGVDGNNLNLTVPETQSFIQMGASWSTTGDGRVRHYYNGTQTYDEAVGASWATPPVEFKIGSDRTGTSSFFIGNLYHVLMTSNQLLLDDFEFLARAARIII